MADGARAALQRLIEERGEDYPGLSRLLGRNAAYVQQYIKRGSPKRLAESDRKRLARYFDVDEAMLGGEAAAGQGWSGAGGAAAAPAPVSVPMLDVGASAGPGAAVGAERTRAHVAFDPAWLRKVASGGPDGLSVIRVEGDSMLPTLADGDEILVDRCDGRQRLRDGIYVLRLEGALMVKRLAFNPAARTLTIRSDNDAYPSWPDCDPANVELVGRAVWVGRRLT
jgi:SOS-response transcriptional repressor LexA